MRENLTWQRKNVTNAVFSRNKEGQLELVFEGSYANYIKMYLQNASSMCKWLQGMKFF